MNRIDMSEETSKELAAYTEYVLNRISEERKKLRAKNRETEIVFKPVCGKCGAVIDGKVGEILYVKNVHDSFWRFIKRGGVYPKTCQNCGANFTEIDRSFAHTYTAHLDIKTGEKADPVSVVYMS